MGEAALKKEQELLPAEHKRENKKGRQNGIVLPETSSLLAYDDGMVERFMSGIVQNIKTETFRRGLSNYDLAALSSMSYVHISKLFNGVVGMGLSGFIKLSFALGCHPAEFMPLDVNHRKTNGERFDELTKDLDIDSCNFLLQMVAEYCKQFRRVRFEGQVENGSRNRK